jgi:hypothetical protein
MSQTKLRSNDFLFSLEKVGLTQEVITRLSIQNGFQQRQGGKIEAAVFLSVLLSESVNDTVSYNDLASKMETNTGISVSKQAIGKKISDSCVDFMQAILACAMSTKMTGFTNSIPHSCSRYKRILIQDSTVVRLPARLFDPYSGAANAHTRVCNARIQVVYDLLAGEFLSFSIDPYSKNDLKAAPELELRKDDLVLRDRGYLTYDEMQRHLDEESDCIYRHKSQSTYLNPQTGKPIDLLKLLKRKGCIDMEVWLNNESRTPVRLVAVPVEEKIANERRRKLKKESKGKNPSHDLLCLMSWTIFITTIPREKASFQMLLLMYGLRWRIESIFKAWKSHLSFARIHNVSPRQLQILLMARLTTIVIINRFIYCPAFERIRTDYGKRLSEMKLIKYLVNNLDRLLEALYVLHSTTGRQSILDVWARYCSYDKRKRLNFPEKMEAAFHAWTLS